MSSVENVLSRIRTDKYFLFEEDGIMKVYSNYTKLPYKTLLGSFVGKYFKPVDTRFGRVYEGTMIIHQEIKDVIERLEKEIV